MFRKKVWLATLTFVVGAIIAGSAAAQYRGYGDTYSGAPDYYEAQPPGPRYGPRDDPYQDPGPPPPRRRYRDQSYDYDRRGPDVDPGYERDDRRERMPYADPMRGDPDGGYPDNAAVDPGDGHAPSDADLGESASRTTRAEVDNPTKQPPGTIVIDTSSRHLYYTQPDGHALQYGIGVGRQGFAWKGTARVARKSEWPDWIPPSDMLKRRPDLPTRMAGGIENPLGARALYLYQGNKDTMFRIHGTNEPDTIGKAVSSGCIRMMNADVIDLYKRVPVGTKVVVL